MTAVQQQPCRAQDRTKLLTGTGHFSVCLRWPLWHEEIFKRLSTHRRAINSFCTLAHSSPHSQTLLQLYSSHCHLCHLGQVQAQVEGHWPDLLLATSSPALAVQVTKSLLASTLSLASVILQMFLVYPSYLYHLPYSRQETELYPLSWEGWLSVLMEQDFTSESYMQRVKFQFLERCAYPLRNKAGLSLTTRHILINLKFLPSVLLAGV